MKTKLCSPWCSAESLAALLLRLAIGMLFFFAGLNKFLGEGGAAGASKWIIDEFENAYLPGFAVVPFAYVLPYVEVTLGAVLILGVATTPALVVSGLLLLMLSLGKIILQDFATVANNLNYVLMVAVGLWLSGRSNAWSLDALLCKRPEPVRAEPGRPDDSR